MDDPTKGALILRPKPEAFKYREGAASTSIVAMFPKKVEFDEKEGYLMWFDDMKYPILGLMDPGALMATDRIKKYVKNYFHILSPKKWLEDFSEFVLLETKEYVWEESRLSRAVREIHRACMSLSLGHVWERLIDGFCMALEHDRPYRYRIQDVFALINKAWLMKNPAKEIKRVLYILAERDHARSWRWKALVVYWFIKLYPRARRITKAVFSEMNLDLVAMDTKDKFMSYRHTGYDYNGLSQEAREIIHVTL